MTDQTTESAPDNSGWILFTIILGSSLAFIDGTVVNVALPFLQQDLDATATGVQWVVQAYSLFLASLILVGGSLGDRLGRRRMYLADVIVFTVASVLAGVAPNLETLIGARVLQGIGALLLLGLVTRGASLVGLLFQLFLALVYLSSNRWMFEQPHEYVPLIILALVPSGYYWGLDGLLLRHRPSLRRWPF